MKISQFEARHLLLLEPREKLTRERIRKQFNKVAKYTHPDKGGSRQDFIILKKARDFLLDKCVIEEYDTHKFIEKGQLRNKLVQQENQYNMTHNKQRKKFDNFCNQEMTDIFKKNMVVEENNIEKMTPKANKEAMNSSDIRDIYMNIYELRKKKQSSETAISKIIPVGIDPMETIDYVKCSTYENGDKTYLKTHAGTGKHSAFDYNSEMEKKRKRQEEIRESKGLGRNTSNIDANIKENIKKGLRKR